MIGALGAASMGYQALESAALLAAFLGAGLLLLGTVLLAGRTWIGIGTIDGLIQRLQRECS